MKTEIFVFAVMGVVVFVMGSVLRPRVAYAKRSGPVQVNPLVLNGIRYEAEPFGKNYKGAHVQAYDIQSGALLWDIAVYKTKYNPFLESDVQDVFITRLSNENGKIRIEDEKKRLYILDPRTRKSFRLPISSAKSDVKETNSMDKDTVKKDLLLEQLALAPRVESRQVGEAGSLSKTWALYDALRRQLSDKDVIDLLRHQSPVVRLYMAMDIAERRPAALSLIFPLFSDPAPVSTLSGCMAMDWTVGESLVEELRDFMSPPIQALLATAVLDEKIPASVRKLMPPAPSKENLATSIALNYLKEQSLPPDDFEIELQEDVDGLVQIFLFWKKHPQGLRGGDGHSRTLLIDVNLGRVIRIVWPR